jgi:hypothetical protein
MCSQQPHHLLNCQPSDILPYMLISQHYTKTYFSAQLLQMDELNFHTAQTESSGIVLQCAILCRTFRDRREICILVCAMQT